MGVGWEVLFEDLERGRERGEEVNRIGGLIGFDHIQ